LWFAENYVVARRAHEGRQLCGLGQQRVEVGAPG
jgi:hypothetical protein